MKCTVQIPIGDSGKCNTYCHEQLNEKGECSVHGKQWIESTDTCPTCLGTGKVPRGDTLPDLQPVVTERQQEQPVK
jgi:hypothetical protein